ALIADPDWPRKIKQGKLIDVRPCLACNACRQRLFTSEPVRCAINAVAGLEGDLGRLTPAPRKKRVVVVGGGPAGMEAARISASRGYHVMLLEQSSRLGGLLPLAAVVNREIGPFNSWLER